MLVLSRKPGEELVVSHQGVEIVVTVVSLRKGAVRLGFQAPADVQILRRELLTKPAPAEEPPARAATGEPPTPAPTA